MITAEEFDALADSGSDAIDAYIDFDKAIRPGRAVQRVNVDFPTPLLQAIDREATRLGVSRQAFIKIRVADTLVKTAGTGVTGEVSPSALGGRRVRRPA